MQPERGRNTGAIVLAAGVVLVVLAAAAYVYYGRIVPARLAASLSEAVTLRDARATEAVLARGASPHRGIEGGPTPLEHALMVGEPEIVRMLLRAGASARVSRAGGTPPLFLAMRPGPEGVALMGLLLDQGADPNAPDPEPRAVSVTGGGGERRFESSGQTALIRSVIEDRKKVAKLLLARGANVNAADSQGWTALHWWVLYRSMMPGDAEWGSLLIQAGADVNARDRDRITVLGQALRNGLTHPENIRLLRDAGAAE